MELRLSCTNPSIWCGISREICPPLDVTPNSCLLSRLTAVVQLTLTRWLPHCVDADRNSRSVNTWQEIPQVKRLIWINSTGGNSWFASWTKWPASCRRFPNEISLKSKCHIKGRYEQSALGRLIHLPWTKWPPIWQTRISNACFFCNENDRIPILISPKVVHRSQIDNNSAYGSGNGLVRRGNKPLFEPILL